MRVIRTLHSEDIPTECQVCDCDRRDGQLSCAVCGATEFGVLWHADYPGELLFGCGKCENAMRVPVRSRLADGGG